MLPPQHLEAGEAQQGRALRGAPGVEIRAAPGRGGTPESGVRQMQRPHLGRGDALMGDQVAAAQRGNFGVEPGRGEAWKFRDRLDIDVERVEENPAVRRIGARLVRAVGKQRVQRIETYRRNATRSSQRHQPSKIAEIAVPPIARRSQRIELHSERPETPPVALKGAHEFRRSFVAAWRHARFQHRPDQPSQCLRRCLVPLSGYVEIVKFDAKFLRSFG